MNTLLFTPVQLVSILGMAQALYALVYMAFRAGRVSRAGLAIVYFFVLFCGFFHDLAAPFFEDAWHNWRDVSWLLWFLLPSLSYLLIIQISKIDKVPSWRHYLILLFPIGAFVYGNLRSIDMEILYVFGVLSGGMSLLLLWLRKSALDGVWSDGKAGRPRYWLIICLVVVNIMFLTSVFLLLFEIIPFADWVFIRNVLGLGFVYLASTSLFRIYPQAVLVRERYVLDPENEKNKAIIIDLERLLNVERVYQEPQYGRKDFARELDVSEATVSLLINDQYKETVPQLLNRHRIDEAKGLLIDTKASIQVVAVEVGFNSLSTFNRVFKSFVGKTPSAFKAEAVSRQGLGL